MKRREPDWRFDDPRIALQDAPNNYRILISVPHGEAVAFVIPETWTIWCFDEYIETLEADDEWPGRREGYGWVNIDF